MIIPTPGRIVLYKLTAEDAEQVNRRRHDAISHANIHRERASSGAVRHEGNHAAAGDVFPMVIVRVWGATEGTAVNGQVLLDGNDTLWVTSVIQAGTELLPPGERGEHEEHPERTWVAPVAR